MQPLSVQAFQFPELYRTLQQTNSSTQDQFVPESPDMPFLPPAFYNLFFPHIRLHLHRASQHLTKESH